MKHYVKLLFVVLVSVAFLGCHVRITPVEPDSPGDDPGTEEPDNPGGDPGQPYRKAATLNSVMYWQLKN